MRRATLIGAAAAALVTVGLAPAARADNCSGDAHCQPIRAERDVDTALHFVMIGDGFTAAEEPVFYQKAQTLFDALRGFAPYKDYEPLFNAYALFKSSAESGITHQTACGGVAKNTAFHSSFGCDNPGPHQDERVLRTDNTLVQSELSSRFPKFQFGRDLVVVIANDSATYGGTGGQVAVVSLHPEAAKILFHEAGHTFAHLADEYWTPYPGFPAGDEQPNVAYLEHVNAKWSWWMDANLTAPTCSAAQEAPAGTPAPIPYTALDPFTCPAATGLHSPVGAFEGARYLPTGVYRPTPYCLMETLGNVTPPGGPSTPMDFCPVCHEAIALSFDSLAEFIESPSPAVGNSSAPTCVPASPAIAATVPAVGSFTFSWVVDNQAVTSGSVASDCAPLPSTPSLRRCSLALGAPLASGKHKIALQVVDASTDIRKPGSDAARTKRLEWNLRIGGCTIAADTAGAGGTTGAGGAGGGQAGAGGDGGPVPVGNGPPACGNGVLDAGEECDGGELNHATCASATKNPALGGSVFCADDCHLDSSLCKPSTCGNGVLDPGEQCDGQDFNGLTCASAPGSPGPKGTMQCSSLCQILTDECAADDTPPAPACGDGVRGGNEECDGADLGGLTCAAATGDPGATGALHCTSDCHLDTGSCAASPPPQLCGNGKIDAGEECDGALLGGATCASATGNATATGPLACSSGCYLDTSACSSGQPPATCGNGVLDPGEDCDGPNLNNATCAGVAYSNAATGTLSCSTSCAFDASACFPDPNCAHSECTAGSPMVAACSSCAANICAADSFCCTQSWDASCVEQVNQLCYACH